jgi:hypothetical protein
MKSALELAMERADATLGDDYVELKDEQKAAIEEIKKQYQAKWAEQEIALKGKIDKIAAEVEPQVLAEHQSQFQAEMGRVRQQIFAERDAKIEEIRQQS